MKKHAFLIIAHKVDFTFNILLQLLDDARNDIYLHIDKKTREVDFDSIKKQVKNAGLFYSLNRLNVGNKLV